MTPIEIFALIVVIVSAIKIIVILINPRIWYIKVVKPVYSNPILTSFIAIILASFVLYYLLSVISIVEIFAVTLFLMSIMAISFAAYSKEILNWANKILKDHKFVKKGWLAILIWILLIIWVLVEIF